MPPYQNSCHSACLQGFVRCFLILWCFECCMMCLKSACPQCLVRAEGAVVNHYAGEIEMYIFKGSLGVKSPIIWTEDKQRREEQKGGRERVRRKQIRVREILGKSWNIVFLPMICGGGRKVVAWVLGTWRELRPPPSIYLCILMLIVYL